MLVLFISLDRDFLNVIKQLHSPQELTLSSSSLVYTTCYYSGFCSNISIFCISIAMLHYLGYRKALCLISQAQNSIGSYFFWGDTTIFSIWHAIEPSFLEAGRDWIIDSLNPSTTTIMPQISGDPKFGPCPQVKGLTLRVPPIPHWQSTKTL